MAARKFYISQPAISKAISKLESSLGVSLFVRSSRGVKLTPDGEILLKQLILLFMPSSRGKIPLKAGRKAVQALFPSASAPPSAGIFCFPICRILSKPTLR